MLEIYICAVIAIAALILTIVLSVILIVSKKEKRRQMKKIKTAAVVSALTFSLMAAATIYLSLNIIIEPIYVDYEIPDLTGLSYGECKTAYTGLFDLTIRDMQYSSEYPEGAIISQIPEGGIIKRPFGSNSNIEILCFVSKGKESDNTE
ncbi:MAG: PASTA domain-containing protein [Oscillospiraceae bacterium]|nr:PASTA domain-containing protein [Oscillospiraceae bacterium]